MLKIIRKFQWPLVVLFIAVGVAHIVVVGFGDALGVSPDFQESFEAGLKNAQNLAATFLFPLLLKDSNRDGVSDILEPEKAKDA